MQISFLVLFALGGMVGAVDFDPFESGSPSSPLSSPQLESEGPIIPDIQFTNSDISMAFQIISDATGWSIFSTEQAGRAKVSLWAKDIRAKELLDQVVELAGFVYHRRGNTISVMTYDEYLQYHGLAKRTLALAHADATSVAAAIKPFLTKLGKSTVHKETNTIVLYETDASLDSIAAVVQKLDTPAEDIEIEIVNLKCAECDSLAAVLQQIFARQIALPRNKTASPTPQSRPVGTKDAKLTPPREPDSVPAPLAQVGMHAACHANQLVLVGTESEIQQAKDLVALMDVYGDNVVLEVIDLKYADAEMVATTLQQVFSTTQSKEININTPGPPKQTVYATTQPPDETVTTTESIVH